ncbi:hypothetical protein SUGI_0148710 [Cryptomeria japonica]|nr:hypothetical protein SUGI_0148710 [Cryptomeria japonica]
MVLVFALRYVGIIFEESLAFNKSGVGLLMAVSLWVIGIITFFLSSMLDNFTSRIAMVSLLRKLILDPDYRRFVGAVVVIAANLGVWRGQEPETLSKFYANNKIVLLPPTHGVIFPPCVVNELEW